MSYAPLYVCGPILLIEQKFILSYTIKKVTSTFYGSDHFQYIFSIQLNSFCVFCVFSTLVSTFY